MGKQFIRVPVELISSETVRNQTINNYSRFMKSYYGLEGQIWVNGYRYTWNKVINEISKEKSHRMKIIAITGNRAIGKSSFARIMTVQLKDVMVIEVQTMYEIPLSIRTELDNVIEIHALHENQWRKVEG